MRHLTITFPDRRKITELDSSLNKCYAIATSANVNPGKTCFHIRTATIEEVVQEESKRLDLHTETNFLAQYEAELKAGYIDI